MVGIVGGRSVSSLLLIATMVAVTSGSAVARTGGGESGAGDSTALERGIYWYENRAKNANGSRADPEPINRAIDHLTEAWQTNPSETAARYLLRAYYVKGTYVPLDQAEKESVFATGKKLGETMIDSYPESVPVLFGYTINLGRWAEVYGMFAAAREGVAGRIRELCRRMIELNPEYAGGGPHRVLGLLHHDAPYIPFLLTWPSDQKALANLEKAHAIAPNDPANVYHYARMLHAVGKTDRALRQLETLKGVTPRPGHRLEDRRILTEAQNFRQTLLPNK